ncbi:MAG: DUF3422 domain-containing protein, partial [Rhodomicrobium sp.]
LTMLRRSKDALDGRARIPQLPLMTLPTNHPLRIVLNDEVHARTPEALNAPCRISYLAFKTDEATRGDIGRKVQELAERFGRPVPDDKATHYSENFGSFRFTYERHSEFSRFMVFTEGPNGELFGHPAIKALPDDWVAGLPGSLIVAANVELVRGADSLPDPDEISTRYFGGNVLVGATVASGAGRVFTDFRIHDDGFTRFLMQDISLTPRQAGRLAQRLLEIDSYRMMALLAFPLARDLSPFLSTCEAELARITAALVKPGDINEPELLERLTTLQAEIENRRSTSAYRFAAAAAYYDIVKHRIAELREGRIEGLQMFQEFTERRLEPAMSTCAAATARQESLSTRVAQATQLLSTKVDVTLEQQNQAVLASMDRRAQLQLRLQETVEGLSVAAITYYIVGLVGYAAKGLKTAELIAFNPEIIMGASIPIVAALVFWGTSRVKAHLAK